MCRLQINLRSAAAWSSDHLHYVLRMITMAMMMAMMMMVMMMVMTMMMAMMMMVLVDIGDDDVCNSEAITI